MKRFVPTWLNRNIAGFSLASLFNDFGQEIATVASPTLVAHLVGLEQAPQMIGIIGGLSDSVASLLKFVSGWLSDKLSKRKPFIVFGYLLPTIFIPLIGTGVYIWQLMLYKTVAWMGKGFREPPRDALLAESVEKEVYGRSFGFQRAMDTLGSVLGLVALGLVINYFSIKTVLLCTGFTGMCAVGSILLLVREIPSQQTKYRERQTDGSQEQLPRKFLSFVAIMALFGSGYYSKMLLLYRAQELLGLRGGGIYTSIYIILLYAIFNVVRAMSEYLVGFLSDLYGRIALMVFVGMGLFGVIALILMLQHVPAYFLLPIFAAAGLSTATITSLERSYAADLLPTSIRGTGYGLLQMVNGFAYLFASVWVGFLWSWWSPAAAFGYVALVSFAAALLLGVVHLRSSVHR